ncbi:MAG: hypothetical protein WC169_01735 [Dehalococcoidia bacterium]|jgi:hypothetical protein
MFDWLGLLWAVIFAIIVPPIVSTRAVRWVVGILHLEPQYNRFLIWLASKRIRSKFALTKKEIRKIFKEVNREVLSTRSEDRIVEKIAQFGLVTILDKKDLKKHKKEVLVSANSDTKFRVNWDKLFVTLDTILENTIVGPLNEFYDKDKVACIVVLPFPRGGKASLAVAFERALKDCLASQDVPSIILTPALLRVRPKAQGLIRSKKNERILVLQPVGMNDKHLQKTVEYIQQYSESEISEILTIIKLEEHEYEYADPSVRHRVVIDLNLRCYQGDFENGNN